MSILIVVIIFDFFAKPSLSPSISPLTEFLNARACSVRAFAVLFTVTPLAFVPATVRPEELTITMLTVVDVFTLEFATIRPKKKAIAMHLT
jgi:hypothetical protein